MNLVGATKSCVARKDNTEYRSLEVKYNTIQAAAVAVVVAAAAATTMTTASYKFFR